jgi:hypothetical protein
MHLRESTGFAHLQRFTHLPVSFIVDGLDILLCTLVKHGWSANGCGYKCLVTRPDPGFPRNELLLPLITWKPWREVVEHVAFSFDILRLRTVSNTDESRDGAEHLQKATLNGFEVWKVFGEVIEWTAGQWCAEVLGALLWDAV